MQSAQLNGGLPGGPGFAQPIVNGIASAQPFHGAPLLIP